METWGLLFLPSWPAAAVNPYRITIRLSPFRDPLPAQRAALEAKIAQVTARVHRAGGTVQHQEHLDGAKLLLLAPSGMRPSEIEGARDEALWRMCDEALKVKRIPVCLVFPNEIVVVFRPQADGTIRYER